MLMHSSYQGDQTIFLGRKKRDIWLKVEEKEKAKMKKEETEKRRKRRERERERKKVCVCVCVGSADCVKGKKSIKVPTFFMIAFSTSICLIARGIKSNDFCEIE